MNFGDYYLLDRMKLWIRKNRDVVFKVTLGGYATIKGNNLPAINKRSKIKEEDVICLASHLSYDFPPDFIAMYYSEDIKYWHELRELIECVCE
jgi:hypothetical protein